MEHTQLKAISSQDVAVDIGATTSQRIEGATESESAQVLRASTSSASKRRTTPPLPVELIRPPVVTWQHDEELPVAMASLSRHDSSSLLHPSGRLFTTRPTSVVSISLNRPSRPSSTSPLGTVSDFTDLNKESSRRPTSSTMSSQDFDFEPKGSGERAKSASKNNNSGSLPLTTVINVRDHQETGYNIDNSGSNSSGLCAFLLTVISVILIVCTLPFSMFLCIKVVQEYERAVIFRLGRLVKGGAKGPGIFFIIPCIDSYCKVDLRTVSFDVPPQEILSRDSVTVSVDAVVYFRISNATVAVSNVEDYGRSTRLLAATTLRNVLGTKDLSQILSERESISHVMQSSLDEATDPWGVKVERVEIKDVRLPVQLQRAMAAEAEAAREARAKVIAAEGEQRASKSLRDAAEVMSDNPAALQLRYLQTLSSIAAEKNSTIVFPIPLELFRGFMQNPQKLA